ncbi:MAG: winged helix-turn-helix domain-containing protein [Chloroflexi bacterium]|nr:winged helix-turn-helix domain-containing protein [Chloroflexota bacterium]
MPGKVDRATAAMMVLKMKQQPLTPSEIVDIGFKNGYFESADWAITRSLNTRINHLSKGPTPVFVRIGDGRYALPDWGVIPRAGGAGSGRRARSGALGDGLAQRVDDRMRDIEGCIRGSAFFSPDRVCLFIEFCHLLELHQKAVDLYRRLPKDEVDKAWLTRIEKLVRVSGQRTGQ